jgi:hypothetical protein
VTSAMQWITAGPKAAREKNDYYPTPPAGTEALLRVETFDGPIWEPACGQGDISRTLASFGYRVVSTDLVDRGYGEASRVDFLMECQLLAPNLVTNPPFKLGEAFARHALSLNPRKVAFLLRLNWLEGVSRRDVLQKLARVWVFSKRLTMAANTIEARGGMIAYAWFIWDDSHSGPPQLGWI